MTTTSSEPLPHVTINRRLSLCGRAIIPNSPLSTRKCCRMYPVESILPMSPALIAWQAAGCAQRKFDKVKNKRRSPPRRKAKRTVGRIHERIRNRRHNFHHQEARKIVDVYGIITVEDLNIAHMSKSPAPKLDAETGKYLPNGHAAKAGLNKSILDAGWYSFRMILKSKAESAGREFYEINPAYTSQDCANCGHRPPKKGRKKLSDRWHKCPKCGYSVPRDKNSAVLQDKIGVGLHTVRHRPREAPAFTPGE